jgi:site-specific recombinase XerD
VSFNTQNQQLAAQFLSWVEHRAHRSPRTVYQYRRILFGLVYSIGGTTFDSLSADKLETYLHRPRLNGHVPAAATVSRDLACVRSFYDWALKRGELSRNPAAEIAPPTVRNKNPNAISDELWGTIWDAATSEGDPGMIFTLGGGFWVGLRREEMTALRPEQVDLVRRRFVNFARKGGVDDVFPYGDACDLFAGKLDQIADGVDVFQAVVAEYAVMDRPFLHPWAGKHSQPAQAKRMFDLKPGQLNPDQINRELTRFLERNRIEHVTPHQLRHSFCTNMLRVGVPLNLASDLMNHSSVDTTKRYIKAGASHLRSWMEGAYG